MVKRNAETILHQPKFGFKSWLSIYKFLHILYCKVSYSISNSWTEERNIQISIRINKRIEERITNWKQKIQQQQNKHK